MPDHLAVPIDRHSASPDDPFAPHAPRSENGGRSLFITVVIITTAAMQRSDYYEGKQADEQTGGGGGGKRQTYG